MAEDLSRFADPVDAPGPDLSSFAEPTPRRRTAPAADLGVGRRSEGPLGGSGAVSAPRTIGQRAVDDAVDAFQRNPTVANVRTGAASPLGSAPLPDNPLDPGQVYEFGTRNASTVLTQLGQLIGVLPAQSGATWVEGERRRRTDFERRSAADPAWRAGATPAERAGHLGAALGGTLAGSIADPVNLVGGGGTLPERMVVQGVVNAAGDAAAQNADIASGLRESYDPIENLANAGLGATIPVGERLLGAVGRGARRVLRLPEGGPRTAAPETPVRRVEPFGSPEEAPAPRGPDLSDFGRPEPTTRGPDLSDFGGPETPSAPATAPRRPQPRPTGPIPDAIHAEAVRQRVDPETAFAIARLENPRFDPGARNPQSTAHGIFQITDSTWERLGGGDRNDAATNIRHGITLLRQNAASLRRRLGREPTADELYLAHQQGAGGAGALLSANPDENAVDALTRAYRGNRNLARDAIVHNGGRADMTVGEFVGLWRSRFHGRPVGADTSVSVGPEAPAETPSIGGVSRETGPTPEERFAPPGGTSETPYAPVDHLADEAPFGRETSSASGTRLPEPASSTRRTQQPEPDPLDQAIETLRRGDRIDLQQGPSLAQWISRRGGIRDLGGELDYIGAGDWHRGRPFWGRLIRDGGPTLEDTAMAAREAGYLPPMVDRNGDMVRPSEQELLDALENELRGRPVYSREPDAAAADHQARVRDLEEILDHLGINQHTATNAEIRQALDDFFRTPTRHEPVTAGGEDLSHFADETPQLPGLGRADPTREGIAAELARREGRRGHAGAAEGGLFDEVGRSQQDLFSARQQLRQRLGNGRLAMEVFHGTGRDFDRFDNAHIGTGEGGAAYGSGHYFASRRDIGEHYRDKLSQPSTADLAEYFQPGRIVPSYGGHDRVIAFHRGSDPWSWSAEVEAVQRGRNGEWESVPGRGRRSHSTPPDSARFREAVGRPLGRLVRADIPEHERFLDWDRPVSEQPAHVRRALERLGVDRRDFDKTGGEIYRQLEDDVRAGRLSRNKGERVDAAVSRHLRAEGVPGIAYKDASARFAGGDSHNYVVFDASDARIMSPGERLRASEAARDAAEARGESSGAVVPRGTLPTPTERLEARATGKRMPGARVPGAVPTPAGAKPGRASYRGPNIAEVANRLKQTLGLTARQGRLGPVGRGTLGWYDPRTGVIRTRMAQELNVLAHEGLGHALDAKAGPALRAAIDGNRKLLTPMAYPGANPRHLKEEGFAEFSRWYLTNPAEARSRGGAFYGIFENALKQDNPQLLADLQALQKAHSDFMAGPSSGVVASMVVRQKPNTTLQRYADAYRQDGTGAFGMAVDEAYGHWADRFHPLNVANRELRRIAAENGRSLGDIKTTDNPYRLARLGQGAYTAGRSDIEQGVRPYHGLDPEGPSIRDILKTANAFEGDDFDNFGGYLISRRMIDEYDRFAAGKLEREPDALSREAHVQSVQDYEAAHPEWRKAGDMAHEWNRNLLRKEHEAGLIGGNSYANTVLERDFYVPAMRDLSDRSRVPGRASGSSTKYAGGLQRFVGSDRLWINPIQSMMQRAYETNAVIARNDALLALKRLADHAGPGSGSIVEEIPTQQLEPVHTDALEAVENAAKRAGLSPIDTASLVASVEAELGGKTAATIFTNRDVPERGEPILYVWENGERTALRLPDGQFGRDMYQALAGMTPSQQNLLIDTLATVSGITRTGVVTHPTFALRNFVRDQLSAWMVTDVGFKPFASGGRGVADAVTNSQTARRYRASGGLMGGAGVSALGSTRHIDPEGLRHGVTVRRPSSFIRAATEFTELAERGTRLGVFRNAFERAKKRGLTDYEALTEANYEARDYFDTDLHGQNPAMLAARRIIPFMNAAIQGLTKTGRVVTAGGDLRNLVGLVRNATPGQQRARVAAYKYLAKATALGVFGLGLTALYAQNNDYHRFNAQERATAWFVRVGNTWLRIPKPFEHAAISNVMERAFEAFAEHDPRAWEGLRTGLAQTLIPPLNVPLFSTSIEAARNRDYAGRPIIPESRRQMDPFAQVQQWNSRLSRGIGGALHVSPALVEHWMNGLLGYWGRDINSVVNASAPVGARVAGRASDWPVISGFTARPERSTDEADAFWHTTGELERHENTFRQFIRDNDMAGARQYLGRWDRPTREFIMSQVFSQRGSGRLNPIERARMSNGVISQLRRDIEGGEVRGVDGRNIRLSPTQRRDATEALAELQAVELSNGLKAAGVPGFDQREFQRRAPIIEDLNRAAPPLRALLELRWRAARVPTIAQSQAGWPRVQAMLERLPLDRAMQRERGQSPATRLDARLEARARTNNLRSPVPANVLQLR